MFQFILSKCTIEKISSFLKSLSQMTIPSKYDIIQKSKNNKSNLQK